MPTLSVHLLCVVFPAPVHLFRRAVADHGADGDRHGGLQQGRRDGRDQGLLEHVRRVHQTRRSHQQQARAGEPRRE